MTSAANIPLIPLRAFVTVGRHGNFTRAARALGITQGGVSRHVATLEAFAGNAMFVRSGSRIEFTPAGLQLYDAVKDAISTIEVTMQLLAQGGRPHDRLKVRTSMPSFAMTVVVPSLAAYTARHGVQVDLITSLSSPQPQDEFDVLITRDLTLPGTESWELIREELVCVGAPALVAAHTAEPGRDWPMVAARSRPDVIATWALGKDLAPGSLYVVATYDHLFLAVSAAIAGIGFLVVPQLLVLDQLRDGSLKLADDQKQASGAHYVAYISSQSAHVQSARDFCRWLKGMLNQRI